MDHNHAAGTVAMWMRVLYGRTAVSGPTRVADAVRAVERTEPNRLFEIAQFAFGATNLEIVLFIDDSDARRVVTAILEFAQPVDDERHYLFIANVTNNSTRASLITPRLLQPFFDLRRNTGDQRIRRHVLRHYRARAGHRSRTDTHRRYQHRVRTDL